MTGSFPSASPVEPGTQRLLEALQEGLPIVPNPFAELGARVGLPESQVVQLVDHWVQSGLIKRIGIIVHHRNLGYKANAMVVWDIPDERVGDVGKRMSAFEFVTLCYRRPRRGVLWPYNLFCMIHGRNRTTVEAQTELLAAACDLSEVPRALLFSRQCFKQRGARYAGPIVTDNAPGLIENT